MDENISGYMSHIGPINVQKIDDLNFEFSTQVKEIHLNTGKMAHGGYLCSIADTGMGNAAHQIAGNKRCVTISLDIKFIAATTKGQKLQGKIRIQKKTNTLVFVNCEINSQSNIIATASGVWKILK